MGMIRQAVLYTALLVFANAAAADMAAIEALRDGDMKKLAFHEESRDVPDAEFSDLEGGTHSLADFRGQWVVLNFWAAWCAPCREEMPTLAALQEDLGGEDFAVIALATGRNPPQAITRFMEEAGATSLTRYIDPRNAIARPMGVMGLPVTVIINPEGKEIARLIGEADWNGESAMAILGGLMKSE